MSIFTSEKKKYFKKKYLSVQKMIWDLEFKREKTLAIREEVRREYDGCASKLHLLGTQINAQHVNPEKICEIHNPEAGKERVHKDKGTCVCEHIAPEQGFIGVDQLERLYDQVQVLGNDVQRYAAQMAQMDIDVQGSPKTNEYPDGVDGINQQLESLRELQMMIKAFIKTL